MRSITEQTSEECERLANRYGEMRRKIKDAGLTQSSTPYSIFEKFTRKPGYAHYEFSGKISDDLVRALGKIPTPEDIIMLVDHGYSHFGATCIISADNTFRGRVNTD
jgi:hypothetical protein